MNEKPILFSGISTPEKWPDGWELSPVDAYTNLWVKLNGAESWDANPWVDVIDFEMLRADHG